MLFLEGSKGVCGLPQEDKVSIGEGILLFRASAQRMKMRVRLLRINTIALPGTTLRPCSSMPTLAFSISFPFFLLSAYNLPHLPSSLPSFLCSLLSSFHLSHSLSSSHPPLTSLSQAFKPSKTHLSQIQSCRCFSASVSATATMTSSHSPSARTPTTGLSTVR